MFSYLNPLPSLPAYRGPHKVGTVEFEIPVSEIPTSSSPPNADITTIKFRLYYPTTSDAKSKKSVYWLPEPQHEWNAAYASFMGASSRYSSIMSRMLGLWNFATLPVINEAPLPSPSRSTGHPVCFFSHGLGGNFNTYSSIVGNLASCGLVCIALEHRDGSSPISFIKNADRDVARRIPYQKHSHAPTPDVLNARNAQLRIRMWELELTYAVIKAMNEGKAFTNYAGNQTMQSSLQQSLNLSPGKVSWAGHSFGACTMTQFVKSVFYHKHLPEKIDSGESSSAWDLRPLLKVSPDHQLVSQITTASPVALLDLWTMPLRGETTRWLWERPLPSYARTPSTGLPEPSTVAVISAEFYKWKELLNRTRAVLSQDPTAALQAFDSIKQDDRKTPDLLNDNTRIDNPIPELNKQEASSDAPAAQRKVVPADSADSSRTPSPARSGSAGNSAGTSQTSLTPSEHGTKEDVALGVEPQLYLIPQSAHLSQSDFGVLFPSLTKYAMKAIEPDKTIELNVRAVLAVVRNAGHEVESLVSGEDRILQAQGTDKPGRWIRVPLV